MSEDLRKYGLVPSSEMAEELAGAARGVPIYGKGGIVRAYAMVDAEDYERLSQYRWHLDTAGYPRRVITMHRDVMGLHRDGRDVEVDHINRLPLDCRRSNLRKATRAENGQNVRTRGGRYSKHRGVTKGAGKNSHRWRAQATLNNKRHHLGWFWDEESAAAAARAFRAEHMPFANEEND